MNRIVSKVPEKEGIVFLMNEPDLADPIIKFWCDGKKIGSALRNGHHLTWHPKTEYEPGHHTLPWILYYYAFSPT